MRKLVPFFFFFGFFLWSCNGDSQVEQRERALAEKERRFADKEEEYQSLIKMRDSIFNVQDKVLDVQNWPDEIAGRWNGKITCKESNCSDYAVGDIRTDTWEFVSDSIKKSVNIYDIGNRLVRTYTAKMENNEIILNFKSDSTSAKKVDMVVTLNNFAGNKIQGNRTVTVNNNCKAAFAVELNRP